MKDFGEFVAFWAKYQEFSKIPVPILLQFGRGGHNLFIPQDSEAQGPCGCANVEA